MPEYTTKDWFNDSPQILVGHTVRRCPVAETPGQAEPDPMGDETTGGGDDDVGGDAGGWSGGGGGSW